MARRVLNILCFGLVMIVLSACSSDKSSQSVLNEGIDGFGKGKPEETYYLKGSGALLDELIEKFSGSYYQPSGSSMSDDEHNKAKKGKGESENNGGSEGTDPSGDGTVPDVSNMTELMRVFQYAYENTSESVEFNTTGGFQFDMNNDLQTVYTQLQREDPINVSGVESWSTWNSGSEYYVSINYSFDVDDLKEIKAETSQLVNDAVSKINVESASDYEIVCAVNEYLCDNVYYPSSEPYEPITHTAYGALKNGCAVCEGYACATKLILNNYGIECDIEVGDCLNGGGHAWNLVKLDNAWYQLDVTWNDQSYERTDYLLVTDDYMKQSRTWKEADYPVSSKTPYTP